MNIINFEIFNSFAEVSQESLDGSDQVEFRFANAPSGYLSIGPRIIKVENGSATFALAGFGSGTHGCYLMVDGRRIELPTLEKSDRLFRMVRSSARADAARVKYLKDLESRIVELETDMAAAKEKILGRKGIL